MEFTEKIFSREENLKDIEIQNLQLKIKEDKVKQIEQDLEVDYKEQKKQRSR